MASQQKTLLAAIIAPSATPLFMLGLLGHGGLHHIDDDARGLLLLLFAASYVLSYTVGIPIYFYCYRRGWRTANAYTGAAFVMGCAAYPLFAALMLTYAALFDQAKFFRCGTLVVQPRL